jgi:hypothetical protein
MANALSRQEERRLDGEQMPTYQIERVPTYYAAMIHNVGPKNPFANITGHLKKVFWP